jgi:hypothetical protein
VKPRRHCIVKFLARVLALLVLLAAAPPAFAQPGPAPPIPCEQVLGGYVTALENLGRRLQQAEQRAAAAEAKLADAAKKPEPPK